MKKCFVINLNEKPNNSQEICEYISKYCNKQNQYFKFTSRKTPISFYLENTLYRVKLGKSFKNFYYRWILYCNEV